MRTVGKIILGISIFTCAILIMCFFALKIWQNARVDYAGNQFPDYETMEISDKRKNILKITKTEWENFDWQLDLTNPDGGGLKYNAGAGGPWCADFVSWVYNEVGMSFENPYSGGWRIPGIYTLQEYYVANNRWRGVSEYVPVPGDVVIYRGGAFGEHTNIVADVVGDEITTVGGNENHVILMQKYNYKDPVFGIWGYGVAE